MPRTFYDLSTHSRHGAGDGTVQEMVGRAARLGFDGVVVADYVAERSELEPIRDTIGSLDTDLDVRIGVTLRPADASELGDMISAVRDAVDVVVVHGGDATINREACQDTRVDVLAHPERGRKDCGIDHVMAHQAHEHRVSIGIVIRRLLAASGKERAHRLNHMRELIRRCQAFDAPVVAMSGAQSVNELRAPRELAAFPRILGMELDESFAAVSDRPQQIIERADRVRSEEHVRPGVEVVDDE